MAQWIKTCEDFFKKIYFSLYLKGFVCERELETEQNCNILTPPAPPDIAVCHSRSPGLLNRGPGGSASLGHVLIPASSHQLVWSPTQSEVPRAPSAGWWLSLPHLFSDFSDLLLAGGPKSPFDLVWLSLPHLVSNSSDLQLTDFLSSLSYIIVQSPTQYLPITGHQKCVTSAVFGMACLIVIKWK